MALEVEGTNETIYGAGLEDGRRAPDGVRWIGKDVEVENMGVVGCGVENLDWTAGWLWESKETQASPMEAVASKNQERMPHVIFCL